MARVLIERHIIENDGILCDFRIYRRRVKKKWYQIFKKDSYQIEAETKFIRATRPSSKILLEC